MQQLHCFAVSALFGAISIAAVQAQGHDWGDSGAAVFNTPKGFKSQADINALPDGFKKRKQDDRSHTRKRFLGACYYSQDAAGVGVHTDNGDRSTDPFQDYCATAVILHENPVDLNDLTVVGRGDPSPAPQQNALNGGLTLD